ATVTTQGPPRRLRHDAKGGDFYLATNGDLDLAISGDFLMATDTNRPATPQPPPWVVRRASVAGDQRSGAHSNQRCSQFAVSERLSPLSPHAHPAPSQAHRVPLSVAHFPSIRTYGRDPHTAGTLPGSAGSLRRRCGAHGVPGRTLPGVAVRIARPLAPGVGRWRGGHDHVGGRGGQRRAVAGCGVGGPAYTVRCQRHAGPC